MLFPLLGNVGLFFMGVVSLAVLDGSIIVYSSIGRAMVS